MAIIETPGPNGKKLAGITKAKVIGVIVFSDSFRYSSQSAWEADYERHRVRPDDPMFRFGKTLERWGWVVESVLVSSKPTPAPVPRGIVYAANCMVHI